MIMGAIRIINVVLLIVAIILFVNLIQPISTITSNVIYKLDTSNPQCYFKNFDELNEIPIDRCCYEIQKQLLCKSTGAGELDLKCYTSESSVRYYLINNKAFNYCKNEGYDVKIE